MFLSHFCQSFMIVISEIFAKTRVRNHFFEEKNLNHFVSFSHDHMKQEVLLKVKKYEHKKTVFTFKILWNRMSSDHLLDKRCRSRLHYLKAHNKMLVRVVFGEHCMGYPSKRRLTFLLRHKYLPVGKTNCILFPRNILFNQTVSVSERVWSDTDVFFMISRSPK